MFDCGVRAKARIDVVADTTRFIEVSREIARVDRRGVETHQIEPEHLERGDDRLKPTIGLGMRRAVPQLLCLSRRPWS